LILVIERGDILKEISDLLRSARENKGLSLDDISKDTKIQKRYLTSLEEGDFTPFPGDVYVKGALRNYAEVVGMNPEEIISLYNQTKYINESKESEEKRNKKRRRDDSDSNIIIKEKKPLPSAALIWIVLVAVVITGSIWYSYQGRNNDRIPYSREPIENDHDKQEDPDDHELLPVDEPVSEAKLTILSQNNIEAVYLLSGVEQKQILLTFKSDCWVRIEQDGRLVEERSFRSGDSKSIGDSTETWIRFGFPPAAEIKVNDLDLTDLKQITNPYNITIRKEM
jgi:cytoskeletal protein RodZ